MGLHGVIILFLAMLTYIYNFCGMKTIFMHETQ